MKDQLTRKLRDQYISDGLKQSFRAIGTVLAQQTNDVIEIAGQKLIPDDTKGYLLCRLAFGFPVVNEFGQAFHPQVIANSYTTMLHQNVNLEHTMVAYDPEKNRQDKVVGSVVAVDFPRNPLGGWKIDPDPAKAPFITAAASFTKLARGMDTIIGKHLSGKHTYSVSLEAAFPFSETAFAVQLKDGQKPKFNTPADMLAAGWEYVPVMEAPDELLLTYSVKKKRIISDFNNRKVVQMVGGLNNAVHFAGFAIVAYQAEQPAEILQMAASQTDETVTKVLDPLRKLTTLFAK